MVLARLLHQGLECLCKIEFFTDSKMYIWVDQRLGIIFVVCSEVGVCVWMCMFVK